MADKSLKVLEPVVRMLCAENSTWVREFKKRTRRRARCDPNLRSDLARIISSLEFAPAKYEKITAIDVLRRGRRADKEESLVISDGRMLGLGPEHRLLVGDLYKLSKEAPINLNVRFGCEHVHVHGLALLAAWCDRYAAHVALSADHPRVAHYIETTGLKRVVEECVTIDSALWDGEHHVAITRVDREARAAADAVAKRIIELFASELAISLDQRKALHVMFAELVENVYRHAESNYPAYVMAQAYPQKRKFHVVVVDTGIGIYDSFRRSTHPQIRNKVVSEQQAMLMALEKRVTSKAEAHAGYGLYVVYRLAQRNRGWLRLMSGRKTKRFWLERRQFGGLKSCEEMTDNLPWRGTEVSLMFDLNQPLPLNEVYRELGPISGYEEDFFD